MNQWPRSEQQIPGAAIKDAEFRLTKLNWIIGSPIADYIGRTRESNVELTDGVTCPFGLRRQVSQVMDIACEQITACVFLENSNLFKNDPVARTLHNDVMAQIFFEDRFISVGNR